MDRNDRLLLILGALGIVLLGVLFYVLLFAPLRAEYATAVEQRRQLEEQRTQLEREVRELESIRRDAPEIQRRILEYSKRIPSDDEIDTLVVQIEEIGDASGVTWTSITPEAPRTPSGGGDYLVVPVTMSFEGDYDQLLDFMRRLKYLARLVSVNEVTYEEVQPDERGGTTGGEGDTGNADVPPDLLRVEIVAETYVQPADGPDGQSRQPQTPAGVPGGSTAPAGGATTGEDTTGGTTAGGG